MTRATFSQRAKLFRRFGRRAKVPQENSEVKIDEKSTVGSKEEDSKMDESRRPFGRYQTIF